MSDPGYETPKAASVEEEPSEQDRLIAAAKAALEAKEMPTFFLRLNDAMNNFDGAQAVAWQRAAVDIYAAGVAQIGSAEMARLYDEQFQDPNTREWLFGHL